MKKIMSAILALVMVLSMSAMVFAATDDTFVPSITYKGAPEVVVAQFVEKDKTELVPSHCLVITPVAKAHDEMDRLPEAMTLLLDVYNKLNNGTMELPASALKKAGLEPQSAIIRDLVDITWICEETPSHLERLADDEAALKITFKMKGLEADDPICVLAYKNEQWAPIAEVVNNGNGTITCTFEHLCPVAFVVGPEGMPETGVAVDSELILWACVLVASTAALAVVVLKRRKNA